MKDSKLSIKLSLIYIALFGGIACFGPYLTLFFQQKGLSYTQIGICYAVLSITGVITQPIWGFITDKYSNKRTTLITICILSSLLIYNFIFARSFYYIILSIFLIAAVHSSVIPIGDAYTYEIMDYHKNIQYGRIRLMGSIGFAVTALILGQVIKYQGISSSYYLYSFAMIFGAILVYSIRFRDKGSRQNIRLYDGIALLKDTRFSIFLLSAVFVNIALGINGSYIAILLQKTGGDVSKLGLLWFILAISELPLLFFGKKIISKFGELNLYFLGVMFLSLRLFFSSISTSYLQVLIIQAMQGITFIFYLISAFQYMNNIIPVKMRTTAMTFYAAICGIGAFIGNLGGGMLLEHISVFVLYRIISLICIIDLGIVIILMKVDKKEIINEVKTANKGYM